MQRKAFLKKCATLTAGVACLDLLMGCTSVPYAPYTMRGNTAIVERSDLAPQGFVLLEIFSLPAPVFVTRLNDGAFSAVLLRCTHRGCTVKPAGNRLQCPCHGSQYTPDGTVINGPAPNDLVRYPVTADTEYLRIRLG